MARTNDNHRAPQFHKRHYEWLAGIIRQAVLLRGNTPRTYSAYRALVALLVEAFAADNPRFNKEEFWQKAMPKLEELFEEPLTEITSKEQHRFDKT